MTLPIPSRCTPECWTPVPCPTCGNDLPPRGRSVPMEHNIPTCCDNARIGSVGNPRHLWDEHDEERWRFYPDEAPATEETA